MNRPMLLSKHNKNFAFFSKQPVYLLLFILLLGNYSVAVAQTQDATQPMLQQHSTDALVQKYARLLQAKENEIARLKPLYAFIEQWMGVPYQWGGCSKKGIDCSCFVMTLFGDVFNVDIKRTSFTQFYDRDVDLFKNKKHYATGDLIFFKTNVNRQTRNNRVTHVGFYLTNGYFVQSSSKGVNIANLNNGFWRRNVVAAGRLKPAFYKKAGLAVPDGEVVSNKSFVAEEDSYFEAPLLNERFDSIIKKYAAILGVREESLKIPELLEYIDGHEGKSFTTTDCGKGSNMYSCLIADAYQKVFNVSTPTNIVTLQNAATILPLRWGTDSLAIGDLVFFKSSAGLKYYDKAGIYLHNNYFLQPQGTSVRISNLNDPAVKPLRKFFGRFRGQVYEQAGKNLMQRRAIEDSLSRVAMQTVDANAGSKNSTAPATATTPNRGLNPLQKSLRALTDMVPSVVVDYDPEQEKNYSPLVNEFARLLHVHQRSIKDSALYQFVKRWRLATVRKRGCNPQGISNQCLVEKYLAEVAGKNSRFNSFEQLYQQHVKLIAANQQLSEGDLLFFGQQSTDGLIQLNAVGVYLNGRYFLAPSPVTKKIELIPIEDSYFRERFMAAGTFVD